MSSHPWYVYILLHHPPNPPYLTLHTSQVLLSNGRPSFIKEISISPTAITIWAGTTAGRRRVNISCHVKLVAHTVERRSWMKGGIWFCYFQHSFISNPNRIGRISKQGTWNNEFCLPRERESGGWVFLETKKTNSAIFFFLFPFFDNIFLLIYIIVATYSIQEGSSIYQMANRSGTGSMIKAT